MSGGAALALGAARLLPIAALAAPLGGPAPLVRALVGLGLVVGALPFLLAQPAPALLVPALAVEGLVGLTLGLVAALPFAAARAAGTSLDRALYPFAAAARPRALGDAYALFALALFAALSGPSLLLQAVGRSYLTLPLGAPLAQPSLGAVIGLGARLVTLGVTLALPALGALAVADLVAALVARVAPAVGRAVESAPLRLVVVALAVAAGLLVAAHQLGRAFAVALRLGP